MKIFTQVDYQRNGKVFSSLPGDSVEIMYSWEKELFVMTPYGHVLQIRLANEIYA
ncbi:MAG: hypothetical protein K0R18_597 [Bacillales bacterium]|jgi:hypothetical protein|nr:hypothetical protein [Bacillales bacterium]